MTSPAGTSLSFNEVEALASKAARGSGLGWGQAEDLGRGARWLAERGFPWAEPLLDILDRVDAQAWVSSTVEAADRASSAGPGERWTMREGDPVYVVPLLAASIYGRDLGVALRWPEATLLIAPDGFARASHAGFDLAAGRGPLTMEVTADPHTFTHPLQIAARPAPLQPGMQARLSVYAARTAVPASAASRALGAGSTRSDND